MVERPFDFLLNIASYVADKTSGNRSVQCWFFDANSALPMSNFNRYKYIEHLFKIVSYSFSEIHGRR